MVDATLFSSMTGEWATPQDYFDKWNDEFHFTYDPASTHLNRKTYRYSTLEGTFAREMEAPIYETIQVSAEDGLVHDWSQEESIFCNPEYGDPEFPCKQPYTRCVKKICERRGYHNDVYDPGIIDWVRKAHEAYLSGLPRVIAFLVPARTDTKWWHTYVEKDTEKRFLEGRLKFGGAKNSAPFPSVLVIWRPRERQC